ncbi:MAG: Dna2/Cas4 domain-containing protein [Candidatus Micrarchaeia archaeon]
MMIFMEIDFNKMIDNYLKREIKIKEIGKYRPSEIVNCMRKIWFTYKIPKPIAKEAIRIFEAGNMLHEFITKVIKSERNPEVELLKSEVPIEIKQNNFLISGRIDDLILVKIMDKEALVEVKSCKEVPIAPKLIHLQQLQLYMYATRIYDGYLVYIERNSLKSKTFKVNYNQKIVEDILNRFNKLHEYLIKNEIPEPEGKILKNLKYICKNCEWKEECDRIEMGR